MANMVKAKMNLATLSIGLSFILTTPYVFFGYDVLFIHAACTLFSMGFIVPALLFFATYNKKTMVLSRGSAFNYQGWELHIFRDDSGLCFAGDDLPAL